MGLQRGQPAMDVTTNNQVALKNVPPENNFSSIWSWLRFADMEDIRSPPFLILLGFLGSVAFSRLLEAL